MINDYLQRTTELPDEVIHLLYSANRWEAKRDIENTLQQQTTIIVDRYVYSGVVFTAAKGIDMDWCKAPDRGLPQPDAVIFLDIDVETAAKRGNYGEERYEMTDFQRQVREKYSLLREPQWLMVDASRSAAEVEEELYSLALGIITAAKHTPLGTLDW
jgi:dTMP kinase